MASLEDGRFMCVNYNVICRNVILEVCACDGLCVVNLLSISGDDSVIFCDMKKA
jgi:hypothetical protein